MVQTQRTAMGPHGDYNPSTRPGDLTGRRLMAQSGAASDLSRAIKNSRDSLMGGEPLEIIQVPSGRSWAIARELLTFIREETIREAG